MGEDPSTSMSGHIDVYVCLVLLDHVDVQPHTLYKIDRYRVELHRKVHALVEAVKE